MRLAEIFQELDISASILTRWREKFGVAPRRNVSLAASVIAAARDEPEVAALKRQIRDLESELDIVKKSHVTGSDAVRDYRRVEG